MIVKGWNNGRPNNETGAGYGIKIQYKDRENFFEKDWPSVIVELEGEGEVEVRLSKSFWRCCPELRRKEIGKWMLIKGFKKGNATWPKRNPPEFELEPLGDNKFRLSEIKPARID